VEITCAVCETVSAPGARFCSACGSALYEPCPACGTEQPVGAAFCAACGVSLQDGAQRGGGADREERRIVSVLFADLAGSTALGEQLDPEDVRELQGALFELVNTQVERFGGVTEKFVGDAVLAVFGIPQAHEDDPERAVRAALAVQEAFPAFATLVEEEHPTATGGARVGLRIGVNTGEVVSGREAAARGELMVSGDAVNVAARLQQAADPGEVLVGDRTYGATSRLVEYEQREGIAAKGKRAPVEAWRAMRIAPRPLRRGVAGLSAPIVGRDEELAVLAAVAARVERERVPQLVTLFGQAGVGKSRLLAEFIARLPGSRLLKGRCLPYGDGITYWPLGEVAKAHASVFETDSGEVVVEKLRAAVSAIVTGPKAESVAEAIAWTVGLGLPGAAQGDPAASEIRSRLYSAWTRYVSALGREQATVLAIEDIHWASAPLLDLVDHLADVLQDTPVVIVCPARPELLESRPDWGAGKQNAIALNLAPLSQADSRRLVGELLDADGVFEDAREQILERADGNPFFLEEILRMLIEEGAIENEDGAWVATERLQEVPIPDSVHGVIAARVDLLDAPSREALRRCSVVGKTFWPAAVDVSDAEVEALARRGLVAEQGASVVPGMREFMFKHALTRDVAYQTLPRPERRDLHRRVGEWVESVVTAGGGEVAEIAAYHYGEAISYGDADPVLAARTFERLFEAAEAATARAAFEPARALLQKALALASDGRSRARALLVLARYELGTNRNDLAMERLAEAGELAVRAGDRLLAGEIQSWASRTAWLAGRWDDAITAAESAVATLSELPESPELATALARRAQMYMLRGRVDAEPSAVEALEVARRVGARFAEVNARINLMTARAARGVKPDAAEFEWILDEAVRERHIEESYRVIVNYLWSAAAHVPIPELEAQVAAASERPTAVGFELARIDRYLALSRARFLWIPSAQWERINGELAAHDDLRTGGNRLLELELRTGMAVRRGDLRSADEMLDEFRSLALGSAEPQRILPMASVFVAMAALAGDVEAVRTTTAVVLDAVGDRYQWALHASAAIPRALYVAGQHDLLMRVDEILQSRDLGRYARAVPLVGSGLRALAEERPSDAVVLLENAAVLEREHGAFYNAALVDLDLARAHAALGDVAAEETTRGSAQEVFDRIGCVNPI
jgi:predicted ATPase/class 3 adenylate cyclase